MVLQRLIGRGVLAHVVDLEGLHGSKRRIGCSDLLHKPHLLVILNPVTKVVKPTGIAVEFTTTVAQLTKNTGKVGKCRLTLLRTNRQGNDILDKRRAIQFTGIDDQPFRVTHLKGMGNVWLVQELTGKVERGGVLSAHGLP